MSRIVATAHVNAVPTSNGQLDLLTYFTDPRAFGAGFDSDESRRLRVSLYIRMGQLPQASAFAARLGDTR